MPVGYPIKLQIWGASASRCCKCKKYLLIDTDGSAIKSAQGEIAHIEGEHNGAKRYNSDQTDDQRNSYPNLMLMCPNDHTEIDNDEDTYSVPVLLKMKADHETWVKNQLAFAATSLSFAELSVVLRYLTSNLNSSSASELKVIPPKEKISKNNLSDNVATYITMGMLRTELVKDYLNRNPDINFATRLRNGFIEKYKELKTSLNGDDLFYSLLAFASGSSTEFSNQAAALTVIVYFFQICDIFES